MSEFKGTGVAYFFDAETKDMAHAARTDFAMTMLLIFLLIYGAGKWSVDYLVNSLR